MNRKIKGLSTCIIVFLLIPVIFLGIKVFRTEKVDGNQLLSKISNEGEWSTTFGGFDFDFGSAIIQTLDGGYALAGATNSFGTGTQDMWLVKTDINGQAEWNQSYGGDSMDYGTDLLQTDDGGFLLAGYTESYSNSSWNTAIWLIKTDEYGKIEWNQFYGGIDWTFYSPLFSLSIIQTSTGEIVIGSSVIILKNAGSLCSSMLLIKTNINGTAIWKQTFGEERLNMAYDLLQTPDGGFVLAGWTTFYGAGSGDMWLVKTDENGTVQWNQTYGGEANEIAFDCLQTIDGGFALGGITNSSGDEDFWLVKTDEYGAYQWSQAYGGSRDEYIRSLLQTVDGEFILGGRTYTTNDIDIYLVKADPKGNFQGSKTYGGSKEESLGGLIQTSNNSFLLLGSTYSYGAGQSDMWLVNTGNIIFSKPSASGLNIIPLLAALPIMASFRRKRGGRIIYLFF